MSQSSNPRPLTLSKIMTPLVVLIIALGIYVALINSTPELNTTQKDPVPVAVRAQTIALETISLEVTSEGNVQPRAQTQLVAQVSGEVIAVAEALLSGGQFQRGDTLLELDPRDYQIARSRLQASLDRARAERDFASEEAARVRTLYGDELASIADLQRAERTLSVAEASVTEAAAALERASIDLERTVIKAPFNGRVRSESVDIGQFLREGANIATIYDTERLEVRFPLADAQLAFLDAEYARLGSAGDEAATVTLTAKFAGDMQSWEAKLTRTEGDISTRSRFLHVIAEVSDTTSDKGVQLPIGLFVNGIITGRDVEDLVRIPRTALRADNTVMVIDENDQLHFRDVQIFQLTSDSALISAGLNEGERVSVSPLQFVVEGMPVQVID